MSIPTVRVSVGTGHRACTEEALTVTDSGLGVAGLQLEGGTGARLWSLMVWPLRIPFLGWSWSAANGLIVQRINEHRTPLMVNGGEEVGEEPSRLFWTLG